MRARKLFFMVTIAAGELLLGLPGQASLQAPSVLPVARTEIPPVPQYLLVTACTEISPQGRSVIHSHLVDNPENACRQSSGPQVHFACASNPAISLKAFGVVQVQNETGVALWSCTIRDASAAPLQTTSRP